MAVGVANGGGWLLLWSASVILCACGSPRAPRGHPEAQSGRQLGPGAGLCSIFVPAKHTAADVGVGDLGELLFSIPFLPFCCGPSRVHLSAITLPEKGQVDSNGELISHFLFDLIWLVHGDFWAK